MKILIPLFLSLALASCASKSPSPEQEVSSSPEAAETAQTNDKTEMQTPTEAPPAEAIQTGPQWSYSGSTGPEFWGDLDPNFGLCKSGLGQSPINLVWSKPVKTKGDIKFDYKSSALKLLDNGRNLQVHFEKGSFASIRGEEFELKYAQFHSSSEHAISGQQLPMEMQLIHENSKGQTAILSVFLIEGDSTHPAIDRIFQNWPPTDLKTHSVENESLNAITLLPNRFTYYHYTGSLTTPPCTEGVNWNVFNTPIQVSRNQILSFRGKYQNNARPLQPLGKRKTVNY